jgi:hypothetical protein
MRRFNDMLLVGLLVLLTHVAQADSLEAMRAQGLQCVEPADIMRKQHMEFLLHQRDLTMRQGIRTKKHSLNQCVECHVQSNSEGEFISINAPEQFCSACHEYASVNIDCFDCHATKPDLPQSANALIQQALGQLIAKELNSGQTNSLPQ